MTDENESTKIASERNVESLGPRNENLFKDECYAIQGAVFEVYRVMGCGFIEPVYQECLETELSLRGIPFVPQPKIRLHYKERRLKKRFRADFLCYDKIILELKAVREIVPRHEAQVLNYLSASGSDYS